MDATPVSRTRRGSNIDTDANVENIIQNLLNASGIGNLSGLGSESTSEPFDFSSCDVVETIQASKSRDGLPARRICKHLQFRVSSFQP